MAAYMTAADLRAAVPVLENTGRYSDAQLDGYVAEFEQLAETYRGVAFTPRSAVETQTICSGASHIVLNWPKVRSIASVVVDGTTADSSTYRVSEAGVLMSSTGFVVVGAFPEAQAVVSYDHGFDVPTATTMPGSVLLRACREYVLVAALAAGSSVPRNVASTPADGASTPQLPDWSAGRPTGYSHIDGMLNTLPDYRTPAFA